jgi:hypothetical protein
MVGTVMAILLTNRGAGTGEGDGMLRNQLTGSYFG